MTVKAIRHHSVLGGRGEDDAHLQYLRLTSTASQTMQGDLSLGGKKLTAGSAAIGNLDIVGNAIASRVGNLEIGVCQVTCDDVILRAGSCYDRGGNIFLYAGMGSQLCGDIHLMAGSAGLIELQADNGNISFDACGIALYGDTEILATARICCSANYALLGLEESWGSGAFIDFHGAGGCGFGCSLSAETSGGSPAGYIKIRVNGCTRWLQFYAG
jgi:hypothetical protein